MIVDQGNYYLYRYVNMKYNIVFYVGMGTKPKAKHTNPYKRALTLNNRNGCFNAFLNDGESIMEIILETNDYEFLKYKEKEFIKLYGTIPNGGTLCNINKGGNCTRFNK